MSLKKSLFIGLALWLALSTCCHKRDMAKQKEKTPMRDINAVMQDHSAELLAKPEVVGFYVGKLDDGRSCITVMLKSDNPQAKKQIPATLEGHPVQIIVSGEIKPMR